MLSTLSLSLSLSLITKIHNMLGTPNDDLLSKFKKFASHIDFNFPATEGTGIAKMIPHCSPGIRLYFLYESMHKVN